MRLVIKNEKEFKGGIIACTQCAGILVVFHIMHIPHYISPITFLKLNVHQSLVFFFRLNNHFSVINSLATKLQVKNQKCSESPKTLRKVVFRRYVFRKMHNLHNYA